VYRILVRRGLVEPKAARRRREDYRRWERDAPMQLWQLDTVGGGAADRSGHGALSEAKVVTGVDDHSGNVQADDAALAAQAWSRGPVGFDRITLVWGDTSKALKPSNPQPDGYVPNAQVGGAGRAFLRGTGVPERVLDRFHEGAAQDSEPADRYIRVYGEIVGAA